MIESANSTAHLPSLGGPDAKPDAEPDAGPSSQPSSGPTSGPTSEPNTGAPTLAPGLKLTRLALNGFKSFADKTTFAFEHPITGVVGPNGCGKSNIVDAIKWVLGERSSKSLRGKEMIDVIFAGSSVRKPAGMAAVSLTFENPMLEASGEAPEPQGREDQGSHEGAGPRSCDAGASDGATEQDHEEGTPEAADAVHVADEPAESILDDRRRIRRPLPYDADEVTVERQLYRDGTSKYLINARRARLRDIRDLFLDTGIGADAYSIIEQGKVDAMLLASPQERRTIFEEAAGIAKFKQRRTESQRKLDRAESNLMRTREQLDSTERRLRIVRGQAAKARRFKELDDECSALRLAVAFDQYDDVSRRLAALTSQLQTLETERNRTQQDLTHREQELQRLELRHTEATTALRRVQDETRETEHGREAARQRRQMAERAVDESKRQLDLDLKRLDEAVSRLAGLEADVEDARESIAAIAERAADAERALDAASGERAEAAESIATIRADHEQASAALSRSERERDGLRAEVETITQRLGDLGTERRKHDDRSDDLARQRRESEVQLASHEAENARLGGEISRLETEVNALSVNAESLAGAKRERAALVDRLGERRVGLDARRATLDDMIKRRAGLAEAARWVMEQRESSDGYEGVIAPFAELLETETGNAPAVEAALGADLQAIVTESVTSGPTTEEIAALPGRVRFVPLDGLGESIATPPPDGLGVLPESRLTPVRSLVRARGDDPRLPNLVDPLLDRLLDRTYLVEDLENAVLLLAGPLAGVAGARVVTRRGEVMDSSGVIDAGPAGSEQGVGLIRHAAELAEIETELASVSAELDRERAELGRLNDAWASVNADREHRAGSMAELKRMLASEQSRTERVRSDLERLGRESASVASEIGRCEARRLDLESAKTNKLERAGAIDAQIHEQQEQAEILADRLSARQGQLESATERMSSAREDASRSNAELDAARRELASLNRALEETTDAKAEHERHAEQARERHARHEAMITEAQSEIERGETRLVELRERHDTQQRAVSASETERRESAALVHESRDRARLVERDWHGVEASRRELEVKRETLEERAGEDLRVDLGVEYLNYRAVMAPGDVERVDIPDAQARVNVLRGEIKKLGNVNLDSIEEEGQLTEADEQLRAQITDLDEARTRLTDLIQRLNDASRDRFGEVFSLIRDNFGGQDGMFRRLFGGGRAEVRLMGLVKEVEEADGTVRKVVTEDTDLLESGIEVIAKPPGKEPRSISQLSGGEKTLTAVALLMAIFRSKPSCFCVLDEVDAALDEGNVGRFCQTVRAFTDLSSFIIITHNKRTMQLADHLYGVTQQERGVSKRVSVRFENVKPDGSFVPAARSVAQATENAPGAEMPTTVDPVPSTPAASKPSGALRRALASMREEEARTPVQIEDG